MKIFDSYNYERRIKTEAKHFSRFAEESGRNSEKVERFSPPVPAFNEAMALYRPVFYEKMPHMALDEYILNYAKQSKDETRIVSLGCGTGDWEIELAERDPKRLKIELVEINEDILKYARDYVKKHSLNVSTVIQDVNKLNLKEGYYDFVVVRSSLHHFVELEYVLTKINEILKPNGKFLIIGEIIGRNGLLLYNETRKVVENIMASLPEKFRFNHTTQKTDKKFPKINYAKDSFEAIRSEEIYSLIMEYFKPVEHVTFDAIISYLLDFRYGPNYDISNNLDKSIIEFIVQLDKYYIENKILKPTTLFGIFQKII